MQLLFLLRLSQITQTSFNNAIKRFLEAGKNDGLSYEVIMNIIRQEGGLPSSIEVPQQGIIYLFKIGKISKEEFVAKMNEKFHINFDFDTFKTCWNDMCTIRPETLSFLRTIKNLQQKYGFAIHVIGNTNKMHVDYINEQLKQADLATIITSHTFSFEVGMFNPEPRIQHIEEFHFVDLRNEEDIMEVLYDLCIKYKEGDFLKETAPQRLRLGL